MSITIFLDTTNVVIVRLYKVAVLTDICLIILLLSFIDCDCQGSSGIKQFRLKVVNLNMLLSEKVQNPYAR